MAAILAAVILGGAAAAAATPREDYERAVRQFSEEGFVGADAALASLERVIAADPALLEAYVSAVDTLLLKHQFGPRDDTRSLERALDLCNRLLARAPENAAGRYRRAVVLLGLGRDAEADADLDRALKAEPRRLEARALRLQRLIDAGTIPEARRFADESVALDPRDPVPPRVLGDVFLAAGQPAEALRLYKTAVANAPKAPRTKLAMGRALRQLERPKEAADALRAALVDDPTVAEVRFELAGALADAGSLEDAVAELERFLKEVPGDAAALNNLAVLYEQTGNSRKAKLAWLKVKEADTDGSYRERAEQHLLRLLEAGEATAPAAPAKEGKRP